MKSRFFKSLTSLILVFLMVASLIPAIAITTSAAEATGTFTKFTGELVEGDYVITYGTNAMGSTVSSGRLANGSAFTVSGDSIVDPAADIIWHIAPTADGTAWTIYNASVAKYAAGTGAKNKAQLLDAATDTKAQWTVTSDASSTTYDFVNVANAAANVNKTLRNNTTYGWACYSTSTGGALTLYKLEDVKHEHAYAWDGNVGVDGSHTLTCANTDGKCDALTITNDCTWVDGSCPVCGATAPECAHPTTTEVAEIPATCTEVGYTAGIQCTVCNAYIVAPDEIPALGHTEIADAAVDATCTTAGKTAGSHCDVCGEILVKQDAIPATGHTWDGITCTVCATTCTIYEKVDSSKLVEGDTIVIYYVTGGLLLSGNASGNKLAGVSATVDGTAVHANNADELALTVHKDDNGDFYFETADGKYLTSGATGNSLTLESTLTDYAKWYFDTTGTTATLRIVNRNAVYNSKAQALEYYNNFTVYGLGDTAAFGMEIYKLCAHANITAIGEAKDATCTEDGITAGKVCADCGKIFEEQQVLGAFGHTDVDPADSKCDTCGVNLCTEHIWVDGEVITEPTCTATGLQAQVCQNCGEPGEDKVLEKVAHTPVTDEAVAPTCKATGLTEGSHCSVCNEVLVAQNTVDMVDHNYVNNKCTMCGDVIVTGSQLADFEFGTDGGNGEGSSAISAGIIETSNGYELNFTTAERVYDNSYDAMGNAALKLGTSSKVGTFTFTVPDNVNAVVIYVSGRQAKDVGIDVNGTTYTITTHSNDGVYTKIVVDTTENKTVTFTTTSNGYRALVNSIEFWGEEVSTPAAPAINSVSLTLNKGVTVNVTFDIAEAWLAANEGAQVVFSNGTKLDLAAGANAYSTDLTALQINSALTVTIQDKDGNVLVDAQDVSVAAYKTKVEGTTYDALGLPSQAKFDALKALLDAIVVYGKAADKTVEGTVTADMSAVAEAVINQNAEKKVFSGVQASLSEYATLNVTVIAENVNVAGAVSIKLGGVEKINGEIGSYINGGVIAIKGLYPTNFNDEIVISYNDGEVTAVFSFNSYLKALYATDDAAVKNIAAAAYNYGVAAEAYNTAS